MTPACDGCGQNPAVRNGQCGACFFRSLPKSSGGGPKAAGGKPRTGVAVEDVRDPPLPEPTAATPGTPEKVEVMAGRAASGRQLFHPGDATWVAGSTPDE